MDTSSYPRIRAAAADYPGYEIVARRLVLAACSVVLIALLAVFVLGALSTPNLGEFNKFVATLLVSGLVALTTALIGAAIWPSLSPLSERSSSAWLNNTFAGTWARPRQGASRQYATICAAGLALAAQSEELESIGDPRRQDRHPAREHRDGAFANRGCRWLERQ